MRQTLLSIAILSALSLPGLAAAEVGPFDTENRVKPPGGAPKAGSGLSGPTGQPKGVIEELKLPTLDGVRSPRSSADGLPTGRR